MHHAGLYAQFRPDYPTELFAEVLRRFEARSGLTEFRVLDLASGAGQSLRSFLRALAATNLAPFKTSLVCIDRDSEMVDAAASWFEKSDYSKSIKFSGIVSSAEATPLPADSVDLILLGSAVHWLKRPEIFHECSRLLSSGGMLMIFEYQFPKLSGGESAQRIAQWIKAEFNQRWRAPGQTPRGKFSELLAPLRDHGDFRGEASAPVPMIMDLGIDELAGFLVSQSRYLDFEVTLPAERRESYRAELREALKEQLGPQRVMADFRLEFSLYSKR